MDRPRLIFVEGIMGSGKSTTARWLARLDQRSLPHFNQLVIWLLLATSAAVAFLASVASPAEAQQRYLDEHPNLGQWGATA